MHKYKTMLCCVKCRTNTENINPKLSETSNNGLLNNLGIKTASSKVPLVGPRLF